MDQEWMIMADWYVTVTGVLTVTAEDADDRVVTFDGSQSVMWSGMACNQPVLANRHIEC